MLNRFVMHAVGNLARNPERLTREDIPYVRFCLCGNNHGFDENGVERSSSSSFWFQAFGDNADRLIKHARKGDQLIIHAVCYGHVVANGNGHSSQKLTLMVLDFEFGARKGPGKSGAAEAVVDPPLPPENTVAEAAAA